MRRVPLSTVWKVLGLSLVLLIVGLLLGGTVGSLAAVMGLVGVLLVVYLGGFVARED
jgi:hypothetical protein